MKPSFSVLAVLLLAASPAAAAPKGWDTARPERSFVFQGRPVDPRCATQLLNPELHYDGPVGLSGCTKPGRIVRRGRWFKVLESDEHYGSVSHGYTVLAADGMRFVLLANSDEDLALMKGQEEFLAVARLQDGTLAGEKFFVRAGNAAIADIDRPDRTRFGRRPSCGFGALKSRVEGHVLRWSQYAAPDDVFHLDRLPDFRKDLDLRGAGCAAKINMEYDLDGGAEGLVSVTLHGPLKDDPDTDKYGYRHCFNAYFNSLLTDGRAELDPAGVDGFADGFARRCLGKAP